MKKQKTEVSKRKYSLLLFLYGVLFIGSFELYKFLKPSISSNIFLDGTTGLICFFVGIFAFIKIVILISASTGNPKITLKKNRN